MVTDGVERGALAPPAYAPHFVPPAKQKKTVEPKARWDWRWGALAPRFAALPFGSGFAGGANAPR
jgi:hypothetical protein